MGRAAPQMAGGSGSRTKREVLRRPRGTRTFVPRRRERRVWELPAARDTQGGARHYPSLAYRGSCTSAGPGCRLVAERGKALVPTAPPPAPHKGTAAARLGVSATVRAVRSGPRGPGSTRSPLPTLEVKSSPAPGRRQREGAPAGLGRVRRPPLTRSLLFPLFVEFGAPAQLRAGEVTSWRRRWQHPRPRRLGKPRMSPGKPWRAASEKPSRPLPAPRADAHPG
nr:uncharacterized protein LOC106845204 [Equus asinus]